MSNTEALPELPEPRKPDANGAGWFTAGQMREYARAALAQPAASGEPVATVRRAHAGGRVRSIGHQVCDLLPGANVQDGTMLYAAPQPAPARVPLTNGDLLALWGSRSDGPDSREIVSYARAVLAAAPGAPDAQKGEA